MDAIHAETLSAFFDGEEVDPELLVESLAQPGANDLLSEFAAMRAHVLRDDSRPRPEFYKRMSAILREPLHRRVVGDPRIRRALAAGVLLGVGIGSFLLGSDSARQRPASGGPSTGTPAISSQGDWRPGSEGGPPVALLRLRIAEWRDTSAPARVEEGARR